MVDRPVVPLSGVDPDPVFGAEEELFTDDDTTLDSSLPLLAISPNVLRLITYVEVLRTDVTR